MISARTSRACRRSSSQPPFIEEYAAVGATTDAVAAGIFPGFLLDPSATVLAPAQTSLVFFCAALRAVAAFGGRERFAAARASKPPIKKVDENSQR